MKVLLLILALTVTTQAQTVEGITDWRFIKEMSGNIPNHPGLTVKFYAAALTRGDDKVKLIVRLDYPDGAPVSLFKGNAPLLFDVSSIVRIEGKIEFNCQTLTVKPVKASATIYQFNGKRHKSKEPPFNLDAGHIFVNYFCERPSSQPKTKPTLKQKGLGKP